MKGRVLLSLSASALIMVGCGGYDGLGISDDSTAEAKRYEILKAIDEGNYDLVIQKLSTDVTYGGAFTPEEGRLNLASAYMGKAGFDINDIINSMVNTVDNVNQSDDFTQFMKALSSTMKSSAPLLLSKAVKHYENISGTCNPAPAENIKRDACFYRAIASTALAATSITTIVKDLDKWINPQGCQDDANGNKVGDDADASACAIEYAVNGSCTTSGATLTSLKSNLTFNDASGNSYTFELVKVDISGGSGCSKNTFYRLVTGSTIAITEGYCDTNFNTCNSPDGTSCYPCPVVDNGSVLTVTGTITQTIESAQDIISDLVQGTDAEQAVNDFLQEVCGTDNTCTDSDIANYL